MNTDTSEINIVKRTLEPRVQNPYSIRSSSDIGTIARICDVVDLGHSPDYDVPDVVCPAVSSGSLGNMQSLPVITEEDYKTTHCPQLPSPRQEWRAGGCADPGVQ